MNYFRWVFWLKESDWSPLPDYNISFNKPYCRTDAGTCWDLRAGNMMWAISVSRLFRMLPSLQSNTPKFTSCCMLALVMALSVVLRKNRHFPSKGWKHKRRLCLVWNGKDRGFDTVSSQIIDGSNIWKLLWKVLSWTHKDSNQAVTFKRKPWAGFISSWV